MNAAAAKSSDKPWWYIVLKDFGFQTLFSLAVLAFVWQYGGEVVSTWRFAQEKQVEALNEHTRSMHQLVELQLQQQAWMRSVETRLASNDSFHSQQTRILEALLEACDIQKKTGVKVGPQLSTSDS